MLSYNAMYAVWDVTVGSSVSFSVGAVSAAHPIKVYIHWFVAGRGGCSALYWGIEP